MAQKPVLVSIQHADVASGNSLSEDPVVSANGRFVAFESFAFNLAPLGPNARKNIFRRDLQTGVTTLVSANVAGTDGGNGDSMNPAISADGRFITFESRANNLVANDTNTWSDIFVRDMQTGVTSLVSVNSAGSGSGNLESIKPTISANGRVIVFQSLASNLSTIDTNNRFDVYARDLETGTTLLVSCNVGCTASGNDNSLTANVPKDKAPRANISNDGRIVVFESFATNLVTTPTVGNNEVYARDLQTGTTTLLSVNMQGTVSVGGAVPVISGDGRFAVFQSSAPNITANDSGTGLDLFRRDLQTGATAMVTTTITNTGSNGPSNFGYNPVVSTDGRYITFQSNAKGYVANDLNNGYDAFRRDMDTNTTVLISGTTNGDTGAANDALGAVMSSDGRYVAFLGGGSNFVSTTDTNNRSDVYLRDVNAGTTTLLSTNIAGTAAANNGGEYPVISADGRFIFFESGATDMVANTIFGINIFGVANQGRVQFNVTGLTANETDSTASFVINRTGSTSGALTVQYAASNGNATPGVDYSLATGSVVFGDGETTKNVVVELTNDALDEFNETGLLTVSDFNATGESAGSLSVSILTITDDDPPPTVSISDATVVEGDDGFVTGSFTVTLSTASGRPVSVGMNSSNGTATPNGIDYFGVSITANIPAGATSQQISFLVIGDTIHEDDETFTVNVSNPTNVTIDRGTATITIKNDDPVPGIAIHDVTAAETNSGISFNLFLTLTNESSKEISFQYSTADGSAQAGSDYAATSGTFTFSPGAMFAIVSVIVNGDLQVEPNENFFVNLTNPTNATLADSQAVATIQNDDFPVLLLEENSQRAAALELNTLLRDPFPLMSAFNFGPDLRTRISLYALNLGLIAGEDAAAVTVSAEDDIGFVHALQVESVSVVANEPTLSQIIVRLPESVNNSSQLKLKVTLRGQTSNVGVIRIASP